MQLEIPMVLENIEEIMAIYAAEEKVGKKLEKEIKDRDLDTCIRTATEYGISRREKILKIEPQDTDSLEDRRFRVLTKWYDTYPYTYTDLMQRLDALLGKDTYTIALDPDNMEMYCVLELKAEKMYDAFVKMMEEIVPLNIALEFKIRYTQYKELKQFTYKELSKYTYAQIRNRKVLGE